jgi:hypothetical protein
MSIPPLSNGGGIGTILTILAMPTIIIPTRTTAVPYYGSAYYCNTYYGDPYYGNSDPRSSATKTLPAALAQRGYYRGPIDGAFGAGDSQCNSIVPGASRPTGHRPSKRQVDQALQS